MAKCLNVSKSGYYKWLKTPPIHEEKKEEFKTAISKIHQSSHATYGRRRIHATGLKQGLKWGKKRVANLMKQLNIRGVGKPKYKITTHSNPMKKPSPNLIVQHFETKASNTIWLSDITYIPTKQGWVYLAIVLDTFSRAIVGWAMGEHITHTLVLDALKMAYSGRKKPQGVIFHSDRGVSSRKSI